MLELRNVRKSFGNVLAVNDLSLSIQPGEVFGFLGPNGAGKTTTISMAVGLLAPDSGTVELAGLGPPSIPANRRNIGVAPQSIALYDQLSARENLEFFATIYGISGAHRAARVQSTLELVALADRAGDLVGGFSGGMKRRLNLAAAMLHEPKLLMLDEPTAGVDPQSRNNILDLVRHLKSSGTTVIYTTHYMEEAQRLCDRVAIIDRGSLLALGTVDDLVKTHGGESLVRTFTKDGTESRIPTTEPVREIQTLLNQGNVHEIRIERPDLESVFLSLTGRSLRD